MKYTENKNLNQSLSPGAIEGSHWVKKIIIAVCVMEKKSPLSPPSVWKLED